MSSVYRCFTLVLLCAGVAVSAPAQESSRTDALRDALAQRPAEDRQRDAGRRPAEVLDFLGIHSGMTVIDLLASSGWYTAVLARVVGPEGTVYAHNTPAVLQMRDGAVERELESRLQRLHNVRRLDTPVDDLGLGAGVADAAITAQNFHDVYHNGGREAAVAFLSEVYHVLKSGGVLGLIDHRGKTGHDNAALHRVSAEAAVEAARAAGFTLEARSDLLANPNDDRSGSVFDPRVRGQTDRFLLRLRKPPGGSVTQAAG